MNPLRCDHIHLIAENIDETARWYCRFFGGKVTFQGSFRGSPVYYLDVAGMTFVIFGRLEGEPAPRPGTAQPKLGVDHFGFAVDALDAAIGELRAGGVTILEGPIDVRPGLRVAYIQGPDQNRIELCERK